MSKRDNLTLVVGFFGYSNGQLDGQTIKTRSVYEMLQRAKLAEVDFFDTQTFQSGKINLLKMFLRIWNCTHLVYIPAHNNLKYFFPFIYLVCKVRRIPIAYVVVGGWLADFIKGKKLHISWLARIALILPQTEELTQRLRNDYGFSNVVTFPNFRVNNFIPPSPEVKKDAIRIVYMARIRKMKGIEDVFYMIDSLRSKYGANIKIELDFFGGIHHEDREYFENNVAERADVNYKGPLDPKDVYNTLSLYDFLVLPTKYYTEGFPGSVLDAYISGIPVVVSAWQYSKEFVEDGISGFVSNWGDSEDFVAKVDKLISDPDLLYFMKRGAYQKSKEYSEEKARDIIKDFFNHDSYKIA